MVQLRPPICYISNDRPLCMQVIKNIHELRSQSMYAEEMERKIDQKIILLKSWVSDDLKPPNEDTLLEKFGFWSNDTGWERLLKLSQLKKDIDTLKDEIEGEVEFKEDLKFKDVINMLKYDDIAQKVIANILPGQEVSLTDIASSISSDRKYVPRENSFGIRIPFTNINTKQINKPKQMSKSSSPETVEEGKLTEMSLQLTQQRNIVQKSIGEAILDSVMDESRNVKLQNKQFDLDLENLDNDLQTLELTYKNQKNNIIGQQGVFKHLQKRNISSISEEVKKDYARWKKVLTPKTLTNLIKFSNLNSQYLSKLNELESNNPTESNLIKLVTLFSKDSTLKKDKFRLREIEKITEEIKDLVEFKDQWGLYYEEIRRILFFLFSDRPETVKNGIFEISSKLPDLKPTMFMEDAKIKSKRQQDVDKLKAHIAEVKESNLSQEQKDYYINDAVKQITGVGGDLGDLDVFEKMYKDSKTELGTERIKTGANNAKTQKEMDELKGGITKDSYKDILSEIMEAKKENLVPPPPPYQEQTEEKKPTKPSWKKRFSDSLKNRKEKKVLKKVLKKVEKNLSRRVDENTNLINQMVKYNILSAAGINPNISVSRKKEIAEILTKIGKENEGKINVLDQGQLKEIQLSVDNLTNENFKIGNFEKYIKSTKLPPKLKNYIINSRKSPGGEVPPPSTQTPPTQTPPTQTPPTQTPPTQTPPTQTPPTQTPPSESKDEEDGEEEDGEEEDGEEEDGEEEDGEEEDGVLPQPEQLGLRKSPQSKQLFWKLIVKLKDTYDGGDDDDILKWLTTRLYKMLDKKFNDDIKNSGNMYDEKVDIIINYNNLLDKSDKYGKNIINYLKQSHIIKDDEIDKIVKLIDLFKGDGDDNNFGKLTTKRRRSNKTTKRRSIKRVNSLKTRRSKRRSTKRRSVKRVKARRSKRRSNGHLKIKKEKAKSVESRKKRRSVRKIK
jgi:hypothetical protein